MTANFPSDNLLQVVKRDFSNLLFFLSGNKVTNRCAVHMVQVSTCGLKFSFPHYCPLRDKINFIIK